MKKIFYSAFIVLFLASVTTFAQESTQEKLKTGIALNYYKNSDNAISLKATVSTKKEKRYVPVKDVIIHFYIKSVENAVGDTKTNDDGIAMVEIPQKNILADSLGNIIFIAKFDGDGAYESAEEEITIKDVQIELSLSVIDSVKTIHVTANEISNGKEIPLEEVDIVFYVQRLFGNLKIDDGSLENGESAIEFPYNDLPGDSAGNITVCVKIEDNETYGNVEKKESIAWGVPVHYTRENSGINLILLWGVGSHDTIDSVFLGIIIFIVILIFLTIIIYKRT